MPIEVAGPLVLNGTVLLAPATPPEQSGTEYQLFTADNITRGSDFRVDVDYTPERQCERVTSDERDDGTSFSVVLALDSSSCESSSRRDDDILWQWLAPVIAITVCCIAMCTVIALITTATYFGHCLWLKQSADHSDTEQIVQTRKSLHS